MARKVRAFIAVLKPAFIGSKARVRASAVVTRWTSLEHHAVVDCGTVVEDVSVLPYRYLGAGLDVSHSGWIPASVDLPRSVEVDISDAELVRMVSTNAPMRALASAASLVSFVPAQILRGVSSLFQRAYDIFAGSNEPTLFSAECSGQLAGARAVRGCR